MKDQLRLKMLAAAVLAACTLLILTVSLWPGFDATRDAFVGLSERFINLGAAGDGIERVDYRPPSKEDEELLTDDQLPSKNPTFDAVRVDRRAIEGWQVNASSAVIALDVPMVLPDAEPGLLTLHPSYAQALRTAGGGRSALPSVNAIDGKAKQFDDGLKAALDLAYYHGLRTKLSGAVSLIRGMSAALPPDSPARPFLAAALTLARDPAAPGDAKADPAVARWLASFEQDPTWSKPIGFYTWSPDLRDLFRFLRFLQWEFPPSTDGSSIPLALAEVVHGKPDLRASYEAAVQFQARLTNPPACHSLLEFGPNAGAGPDAPRRRKPTVAVFPPSTSREAELFARLFPGGLPPDANLMRAFISAIRSGQVSLEPRADSGWYDYQVHALETLLLPERGEESGRLLLSRSYKKRMLDSFQALMTKRRETHVLALEKSAAPEPFAPLEDLRIAPRLRVEPALTYFLRTARAYQFLSRFLEEKLGREALESLHGLRQDGKREMNLFGELQSMRELFLGLYLLGAEDLGSQAHFEPGESVDVARCERIAEEWLKTWRTDPDLAIDTRVAVPIGSNAARRATKLWVTLGVRLAKLDGSYARPPMLRPVSGGDWTVASPRSLQPARWLIAVDEFAEVEIPGVNALTREELRAVCDRFKSKDAILKALSGR